MTSSKSTKRALVSSALAILMCVAMLIGTTFAWFTDTASTAVNKIQSGKLDVALEMSTDGVNWESAEGKTLTFKTKDNRAADKILWEPGCTYELPALRVVNNGNLALKYKIQITGIQGDAKLNEVIDWTINNADINLTEEHLLAGQKGDAFTIKGHMQETAGNNYQDLTIDGIGITVYATQYTYENDSYGPEYDKDAPIVYPEGVTTESFEQATSVYYTHTFGEPTIKEATGDDLARYPATIAYIDADGAVKYAADVYATIVNGATTIYCKENATIKVRSTDTPRTPDLTNDLTIYANGADFQYGEISMDMTSEGKAANITLKVYGAKNIAVWGMSPNANVTQNVILENCTYEGTGVDVSNNPRHNEGIFRLMDKTGTINLTLNNCKVTGSNQGIYKGCDGDVIVTNSSFEGCAAAMKISHKGSGTCNVTVKDTTFNKCGWDTEVPSATWLKEDSSSIKCKTTGTMTLTLDNVAINDVVGSNSIVTADGVTVNATNVTVDGTPWTK